MTLMCHVHVQIENEKKKFFCKVRFSNFYSEFPISSKLYPYFLCVYEMVNFFLFFKTMLKSYNHVLEIKSKRLKKISFDCINLLLSFQSSSFRNSSYLLKFLQELMSSVLNTYILYYPERFPGIFFFFEF